MLNPIRLLAKCHYRKHFAFLILKGTKVYDTHHLLKFSIKTSYLRKSYTHVRILLLGWTQILDLNIKSYHILPRLGYGYGQSTEYLRYVILEDSLESLCARGLRRWFVHRCIGCRIRLGQGSLVPSGRLRLRSFL